MRAEKKGKRTWFYITDDDEKRLEEIVRTTRLAPAFAMSELASAAIQAVHENGGHITFPVRFAILPPPTKVKK